MSIADYIPYFENFSKGTQILIINLLAIFFALLIIWIVRRFVLRLILSVLRRLAGRTTFTHDDRLITAVERPLRLVAIGIAVLILINFFNFTPDLDQFATRLGRALILAAVTFLAYNLVGVIGLTSETLKRITGVEIEPRLLPFLRTVAKVFIVLMGFLIILDTFEYDVTGLIASFGIVGLAFSLAAQDTAANVFGFTAIVSDNPFEVGDFIKTADFSGAVEHVGVRSTRIRQLDQSLVIVPNSTLTDSAVTNWSRLIKRRLDFMLGLTYDASAAQLRELVQRLRDLLAARELVDPESVIVHFVEFGDSALNVRVIAYVMLSDWAEFTAEQELINLEIMELIESMGLGLAFPSRTLYIESVSANGKREQPEQAPWSPTDTAGEPRIQGKAEESFQDNKTESGEDSEDDDAQ